MNDDFISRRLTLDDLKPYLTNLRYRGKEIVAACPICEAGDPKGHHLYIDTGAGDKLVMHCQKSGADFRELMQAFRDTGAKHEVDDERPRKEIEKKVYEYRNPDGTVAYFKLRRKFDDGSKDFSAFHYDEHGNRKWSFPKGCNALYNLNILEDASKQADVPILYIVEGEKCAMAMTDAGFVATTSNTGARKKIDFTDVDREMLSRFPVKIIIPDNDEKGYEYVEAWPDVDVLPLPEIWPECPRKGDVADYFAAGGDVETIREWRAFRLDDASIDILERKDFIDENLFKALMRIRDKVERARTQSMLEMKAQELKCAQQFKRNLKAYLLKVTIEKGGKQSNKTHFKHAPIGDLECGEWIADMAGIRRLVEDESGQMDYDYASYTPITISSILRNIENGMTKMAVSFYDEESWKTVNVERKKLTNVNDILELANLNVDVNSETAKSLIRYLACIVNSNDKDKLPSKKSVSHLGWVGNKFVPFDEEYALDSGREHIDIVSALEERGEYAEWVKFVKPLRENIYMRMILNASFASVLLEKVEALPFILHLWGGTGNGKSVSMLVAASVWGNPAQGKLFKALNGTPNYICQQLCFLKHLPFFGDELQTLKRDFNGYDNLIMRLTEGTNKGRLNKNAIIQDTPSWKNILITTGEETCTQENSGGGTKNRVIEIECKKVIVEDGHGVSLFVKSNYGTAGRKFLECLKDYDLPREFKALQRQLSGMGSTAKQYMAMATLLLADKITSEKIFHTPMLTVDDIGEFLKDGSEVDKSERAYEALLGLIEEHRLKFNTDDNTEISTATLIWGKISSRQVAFVSTVCVRELRRMGYEFDAVKESWFKKGYVTKDKDKKFSHKLRIVKGGAAVRCIVINRPSGIWVE